MNDELIGVLFQDMKQDYQDLTNYTKDLEFKIGELEAQLAHTRKTHSKEQTQLKQKIQRVKQRLLHSTITRSGYNDYSEYKYFELKDIIQVTVPALLEEGLSSEFSKTDTHICLEITDSDTGAYKRWNTRLKVYPRKNTPKGDLTYLMKDEQAVQTYARRTLWLLALDIVEPVPEEVDVEDDKKQNKPQNNNQKKKNQTKELELPDDIDDITQSIFDQIQKDFGKNVPFNKTTVTNKLNSMLNYKKIDNDMHTKCMQIIGK